MMTMNGYSHKCKRKKKTSKFWFILKPQTVHSKLRSTILNRSVPPIWIWNELSNTSRFYCSSCKHSVRLIVLKRFVTHFYDYSFIWMIALRYNCELQDAFLLFHLIFFMEWIATNVAKIYSIVRIQAHTVLTKIRFFNKIKNHLQ